MERLRGAERVTEGEDVQNRETRSCLQNQMFQLPSVPKSTHMGHRPQIPLLLAKF